MPTSVLLGDLQLLPGSGPGAAVLGSPAGVPADLRCSVIWSWERCPSQSNFSPNDRLSKVPAWSQPHRGAGWTSVPHGKQGGLREAAAAPAPAELRPIEASRTSGSRIKRWWEQSSEAALRPRCLPWPSLTPPPARDAPHMSQHRSLPPSRLSGQLQRCRATAAGCILAGLVARGRARVSVPGAGKRRI